MRKKKAALMEQPITCFNNFPQAAFLICVDL